MTPRTVDALADADARRAIAGSLDETLVVEAAAGTGKTTELVTRLVAVLATGRARMDGIVAVTFTERAAGELKLRLRGAIETARARSADAGVRGRLETALRELEEAHVSTIHGFCAELLRERPVEAQVDPLFTVLTDAQAERLYARTFRAWLQEALASPPPGVRRALRRSSGPSFGSLDDAGPIERLRGAGWTLAQNRDFAHPWTSRPFDRDAEVARLVETLRELADSSAKGPATDNLYLSLDRVRRESHQIQLEQSLGQHDADAWEARLVDLFRDPGLARTRKGYGAKYGPLARADVMAARDRFFADLLRFRSDADGDLAARLQEELKEPTARYQRLKRRKGALDFADLLACTRDLLRGDRAVRSHLQARFTKIFVDEFQDTDPVQAEILLLLSSGDAHAERWVDARPVPGKLFIVGDPKQAIYRFRGADVGTYWAVRNHLAACGGRVLQLTTNFRSVPAIQRFVNGAFEHEMAGNAIALQAAYVPLEERRPGDEAQPAVVALPVPAPYSSRWSGNAVTAKAVDASLPDAVGAFIDWLVHESGWHVPEPQPDGAERRVPIEPRHVAVLFRRFTSYTEDTTRPYLAALDARGIPHLLVGGKAFHDREEVEAIRAALAAIEWPDDELSVFATLKGSLFAIDDEPLLEYRHRFGAFHPFRIPRDLGGNSGAEQAPPGESAAPLLAAVADALRLLQQLHRRRNVRPVADTIAQLLGATRAHVGLILRPGGEQALANVLHVAELARQYEAEGGISFRGFIDQLRHAAEATSTAEAPVVEEGSDGVRLMTVHKAKGLEFPVVVLADLTCRLSRDEASRYLDAERRLCAMKIGGWAPHDLHEHESEEVARDRAEGIRLAYVAATRARDLLVVPAVGDGPWEGGWLAPLNGALYPPPARRHQAAQGPGCPPAKSADSVLFRPDDRMADAHTVSPGLHAFDGYSVVWCDPRWFTLGVEPVFGVRRQELIVKEVPRAVVEDGRRVYESWRAWRDGARRSGGVPSLDVRTVREWAADGGAALSLAVQPDEIQVVTIEGASTDRAHGGGPLFGLLVHAVLAGAPLDTVAGIEQLGHIAALEGRALGATDAQAALAAGAACRVMAHDLLAQARAAFARDTCRREVPVTLSLADGTLVEGIVDLAFEQGGTWTVVDYKTDRELAAGEDRYRRQLALYATAIAEATGQSARAVLVRV